MILKQNKVVLNISNIVTSNQCANIILAAGASPVMSRSLADMEDLLKIASALVINLGTVSASEVEEILAIQKLALEQKIPVILDPVGSGASRFRTHLAQTIVNRGVSLIRGNASELNSLVANTKTKGVDGNDINFDDQYLLQIAAQLKATLLVTGAIDYIVSENQVTQVAGGHVNMRLITGMGCMLTALVGALCTEFTPHEAALKASRLYKKMGQKLFQDHSLPTYTAIYNQVLNA